MSGLRCEAVAKAYGDRRVLVDVDLDVPQGTLTAILGASGSGKTTLLRVVMGFVPADRGTVSVGGRVVADGARVHLAPDKRAIGYVAQEGALFPHLSVAENVGFGLPRALRRHGSRIAEALELVGLSQEYAARRPGELSGGEQRRVALARALAPQPAVVLLDEPFSGLDAALRAETRAAVLGAMEGSGATAVLVTHDQAEALSMGREVAVLRAGRLVQTAAPAELYRAPTDLDVARFVGEAVVLRGEARDGAVACGLGTLAVRGSMESGAVSVMIRPEQIRVTTNGDGVAARVVARSFFGPDTVLRLELPGGDAVSARVLGEAVPAPGDQVHLRVDGPVAVFPA
jgi:iron(III) transport system ATP-binding protein